MNKIRFNHILIIAMIFLYGNCQVNKFGIPVKVKPNDCMGHTLLNNHIYKFTPAKTYSVNDIVAYQTKDIWNGKEFITVGRIMGVQGDRIEFKYGDPFRNGRIFKMPPTATRNYLCISKNKTFTNSLLAKYNIDVEGDSILLTLTDSEYEELKKHSSESFSIQRSLFTDTTPDFAIKYNKTWNRDFFCPLNIPSKLSIQDTDLILVCGSYDTSQLIKDSVYFMVNDNIQNAFDSKYMGLVSKKLIIGKLSY
jgi:signal peptidase I